MRQVSASKGMRESISPPAGRRHGVEVEGILNPAQVAAHEGPIHLEVRLPRALTTLKPLLVQAKRVDYTGRLSGYYQRLEHQSDGTFITREQIDRENPQMLTQMLSRVAGINSTRMRAGGSGVRMRGRNCWPLVWLDGLPMG